LTGAGAVTGLISGLISGLILESNRGFSAVGRRPVEISLLTRQLHLHMTGSDGF